MNGETPPLRSAAFETVAQARFFLERARQSPDDRIGLRRFVEAAIVFGRSVTFHLQKEFNAKHGFSAWYEEKQREMSSTPLMGFLLQTRNYILKEGAVAVRKTVSIEVREYVVASASVSVKVRRGRAWFRRPLHIRMRTRRRRSESGSNV
jgi:hypothetical protein